ncbi:MAG: pyridoxal-dependent decarboxylase [Acidobacteriota bacterium]|nr:pyridoxal-dependent decarboxylase [Acidobacteriota bacterium]
MSGRVSEGQARASLLLEKEARSGVWRYVVEAVEGYLSNTDDLPIKPDLDPAKVREALGAVNFDRPLEPLEALELAHGILLRHQTHTPHPRYFGLYDPAPATMGIAGEALAAAFNPQLSVWSHSPGAAEVEQLLVRAFCEKFGYDPAASDGTFTSGGAEANHTALLTALTRAFPEFTQKGLRSLPAQPVLYVSAEGHHSVWKAARLCGLGTESVREVGVDDHLRMDAGRLADEIARDKRAGLLPFLVVATAATTSAGAVDPLRESAETAAREGLWLHVDAAWGGAAVLVPELRRLLDGIELADSITFDPHKWLSVPRGAGLYLTRHPEILGRTFHVSTAYMPLLNSAGPDVANPFMRSMQWSRRFTGLKLFLTLAVAGWEGYAEVIRRHVAVADDLREKLEASGWRVVNDPALAVVCFVDRAPRRGASAAYLQAVRDEVVSSGRAWVSVTRLAGDRTVIRACVTNYRTGEREVDALVSALNAAREKVSASSQ